MLWHDFHGLPEGCSELVELQRFLEDFDPKFTFFRRFYRLLRVPEKKQPPHDNINIGCNADQIHRVL